MYKKNNTLIVSIFFVFFFLGCFNLANASSYYVSNTGSDSNNGTSTSTPWKTIAKVNSATFLPGDNILFNKGDTWTNETINIKSSGNSSAPITYSAYGTGEKPTISGFTTITDWTPEGNGIYSKVVTAQSTPQMVTIDDTQYAMGRWPNTGWRTITGISGGTQISDSSLPSTPSWTGAEVVTRTTHWSIEKSIISNHTTNTLTFGALMYTPTIGFGYFIQNSLSTLDTYGEWYYNTATSKFYMYFGAVDPTTKTVRVSTLDKGIVSANKSYITIDGLAITGANTQSIYLFPTPSYTIVQNCDITYSGGNGIYAHYPVHSSIIGSTFNHTNNAAILFSDTTASYSRISGNIILNTGTIAGAGNLAYSNGGYSYSAISSKGSNGLIEHNSITNTGYLPIGWGGQNTVVQDNFIDTYCNILDDGGGIYVFKDTNTGKQVLNNIVLNAIGAPSGTDISTGQANGLYSDGFSTHILFSGNTVGNISGYGFHSNAPISSDLTISNNTFFQMPKFISIQRWPESGFISGFTITNNIFVTTALSSEWGNGMFRYNIDMDGQDLSFYNSSIINEVAHLGTINSNYYYTNIDRAGFVYSTAPHQSTNTYTNSSWKSTFGFDTSSLFSVGASDPNYYRFEYNDSSSNKTITLTQPMIDAKGIKYNIGNLIIAPYSSIILMADSAPVSDTTPPTISSFTIPSTSSSLTVPISTFTATDASGVTGYLLTESSSTPSAGSGSWSSTVPTSYLFSGAGTKTLYAWAKDAAGNVSTSVSRSVTITLSVTTYTLTYTANANGTLTGTTTQVVNANANGTAITAVPNAGYRFVSWSDTSTSNPRTDTNVTANKSVSATFTLSIMLPPEYSVYSFEESSGSTVLDSQSSHNGTILNEQSRVNGISGKGLSFTGTGYVNLGHTYEDVSNGLTLSAWIKPNTISGYQGIIMHGGLNTDTFALYTYYDNKTIALKASGVSPTEFFQVNNINQLWDGSWHHVVATYNGSQSIIYLDGQAIGQTNNTGMIGSGTGYNLLIGSGRDTIPASLLYSGLIDEVRVYKYVLNSSEITTLYNLNNPATSYTYTLTLNKSGTGNGTVSGAGIYNQGTVVTAIAAASTGSTFTGWSGDCNTSGVVTMNANKICTATFAVNTNTNTNTYTINSSTTSNGTISPLGTTTKNYATSQIYTITPSSGYHIESVLVDGIYQGTAKTYTFTNISANHIIAVAFAKNLSISSISAISTSTSSITVTWVTSENSSSQVEYGTSNHYGMLSVLDSTLSTFHSVVISNLKRNTNYHYRVKSIDISSNLVQSTDKSRKTLSR